MKGSSLVGLENPSCVLRDASGLSGQHSLPRVDAARFCRWGKRAYRPVCAIRTSILRESFRGFLIAQPAFTVGNLP